MEKRLEIAGDLGGITLCFGCLKGGSEGNLFFCGLTSVAPHSWGTLSVHIWCGQKISKKIWVPFFTLVRSFYICLVHQLIN